MSKVKNNMDEIDATEWPQIFSLFDEYHLLPQAEQNQNLTASALSKPAKTMLQRMLNNHDKPFILNRTIDPLVEQLLGKEATEDHLNPTEIIGRNFGPWRATAVLGHGGMGQVFTAERADGQYEKQVALKIIKSGHFSALSKQRFLDEMRTLAQFEHPNIAHLIDGGTSDDDIAYFVMERVSGQPIVDYANQNKLSLRARIRLLIQAIDATEYAHQNLIIHGDIKPANLLVNEAGQIKLVDFGIARPVQSDNDTYLPQFTPSYSAPEQAQGKPLTTASDVFGLCAVLYELCTGTAPRKCDEETTESGSDNRLNEPITPVFQRYQKHINTTVNSPLKRQQFSKALAHELGAIIDKGLHLKPADRYKNTTQLHRDLALFMAGSAVPTFATSWRYRWRKTITKHKWPVTLSALALLSIIMVAMVAVNQARLAQQEADKAQWANQFLLSIFASADPVKNQRNPITVNALTAQAADNILQDDTDLLLKTESLGMLSQIQYRLGEINSAEQLILEQISLLEKIDADHVTLAAAHTNAGNTMEAQDNLEQSVYHFRQAVSLMPISETVNKQSVRAAMSLANSLQRLNKMDEAELLVQSLSDKSKQIQTLAVADSLLASLHAMQAKIMLAKQDFKGTIKRLQTAKEYARKVTDEPLLYPHILGIESDAYYGNDQSAQSAELDREIVDYFSERFGEDHPETIDNLGRLAVSLASLGELESAIEINQRIITNLKGVEIKGHQLPAAYLNKGTALQAMGAHKKALEHFQQAATMWPNLSPRIPFYEAATQVRMATSLLALKKHEDAQRYFIMAIDGIEQEYGQDHPLYARFQIMYAPLLLAINRLEEAESIIPKAYQAMVDTYGEHSKYTAIANLRWAQLNRALGDHATAVEQAKQVVKILDVPELRKRNQDEIDLAKKIAGSADAVTTTE